MQRAIFVLLAAAAAGASLWACNKAAPSEKTGQGPSAPEAPTQTDEPENRPEAPAMTDMDPKSPEAWKQAEAIAATAARGKLEKRSDALPFMFMADAPAAVLVHQGHVVTDKGAAAAGRYLRDLGVIRGEGPAIADVLFVLFAFDAWPPITEVPEQRFVNVPDDPALADLTARLEHDGEAARVVLHYFLPEQGRAPGDEELDVGDVDPEYEPVPTRPVARATLDIPETGEPAWRPIETLNWADERGR